MRLELEREGWRVGYVAVTVGRYKLRWWRGQGVALMRRVYP